MYVDMYIVWYLTCTYLFLFMCKAVRAGVYYLSHFLSLLLIFCYFFKFYFFTTSGKFSFQGRILFSTRWACLFKYDANLSLKNSNNVSIAVEPSLGISIILINITDPIIYSIFSVILLDSLASYNTTI